MEMTLSVRHAEVPDALKEYVRDQVAGLSRYFGNLVGADLILDQEGHRSIAEVRLQTSVDIHIARDEGGDMRTAVDGAIAKLRRQLDREKGKLQNHGMTGEERQRIHGEAVTPGEPSSPDPDVAPVHWPRISASDASAQLENTGEEVLVFVDSVDGEVKIARRSGSGAVSVEEAESFELDEE